MKKSTQQLINYIWPPLIIAAIIFYLCCLITPSDVPDIPWDFFIPLDKVEHFLMYMGLAGVASFNYVYRTKGNIIILRMIVFAVVLPILYGGLIEILQANFFNRTGDIYDFMANALGAVCSIPFTLYFRKILLRKYNQ